MAKILVAENHVAVPLTEAELAGLERDEPLYLGPEDITAAPAPPPPTLDEVARRAAQIVLEIQSNAPQVASPTPRRKRILIDKDVERDENNRIKRIRETHEEQDIEEGV